MRRKIKRSGANATLIDTGVAISMGLDTGDLIQAQAADARRLALQNLFLFCQAGLSIAG